MKLKRVQTLCIIVGLVCAAAKAQQGRVGSSSAARWGVREQSRSNTHFSTFKLIY